MEGQKGPKPPPRICPGAARGATLSYQRFTEGTAPGSIS